MSSDDKRNEQTRLQTPGGARSGKGGSADDIPTGMVVNKPLGKLTVVAGPGTGTTIQIPSTSSFIGRDKGNEIPLDFGDDTIHRKKHAAISVRNNVYRLYDVTRGNPVSVNGTPLEGESEIRFGDRIGIGSTTLRLDPP